MIDVIDRGMIMCDRLWYDLCDQSRYDLYIPLKLPFNFQCPPKLPIVSMSLLKLLKNVNVPPNDKNTLYKIIKIKKI
jgi:hypothetical protein